MVIKQVLNIDNLGQLDNTQSLSGWFYITVGQYVPANTSSSEYNYSLHVHSINGLTVYGLKFSHVDMENPDIINSKLKELEKYGFYITFVTTRNVIKSWKDLDGISSHDDMYCIHIDHLCNNLQTSSIEYEVPTITIYHGLINIRNGVHLPFMQIIPTKQDNIVTVNLLKQLGFNVELSVDFMADNLFKIKTEEKR